MKFKNNTLEFEDADGDRIVADVYLTAGPDEGFLIINVNRQVVSMTCEEARKFAKAIRKEVRKAQL